MYVLLSGYPGSSCGGAPGRIRSLMPAMPTLPDVLSWAMDLTPK